MTSDVQPLPADQERMWGVLTHALAVVSAWYALGFIAPLVILLVLGPRSTSVREHAVEALNFNLTWLIYAIVAFLLAFLLIGIPILILLGISYLILVVMASMKASNGEHFRYPLTIRFVS